MDKIKTDTILKNFWRDNERFASLFNTVVFNGEKVIKPENLEEVDTDASNIIEFKEYKETLERARDVIKKTAYGIDFVILGIENQMKTHYAMPLRVMIYDALGYLKEYQEISKNNKKSGTKFTAEEYLSALKKEDKLHPVVSIVIYYGEKPWDGPLSLKDMMADMPEEIDAVFSDYKMNLLQVIDSSKYHFDNEDVQTVFEITEGIFDKRFDDINRKYGDSEIESELAMVIGAITTSENIIKKATEQEVEDMRICEALQELEQRGVERGIAEGLEQGIAQEKKAIILQMLKKDMDKELIKEITRADDALIDELA